MSSEANTFDFSGINNKIKYVREDMSGHPQLSLTRNGKQLVFTSDQIVSEKSELGEQATVVIETVMDSHKIALTLLLPDVNLKTDAEKAQISTVAIEAKHHTTFGGPDGVDGQLDEYTAIDLKGTASLTYA